MKTTVTELEESKVRLDVEVPVEEVQAGIQRTLSQLAREIKLPGFRKGKVPPDLVLQRFGLEVVIKEMLEEELPKWYSQAVRESEIVPVDQPEIDFEQPPERDNPFVFQAVVPVLPTPVLGEYKGLEVPREGATVQDEEVDRQIERLREEFAELRPVSGRSVQEGDFVTVDFVGRLEGEEVEQTKAEDYVLEVGAGQLLPSLEEGIIGMVSGEVKTIPVEFPEDYPSEDVAGNTLDFEVTVKEIKEKVLPPLNDEFAKDVSEFETLLELRLDIRKKLQAAQDDAVERRYRARAVRLAAQNAQVDVPESVISEQAQDMVGDFAHSLSHQGTNLQQYMEITGTTVEQMIEDVRPQAEDTVRASLVLEEIAKQEGLEVDEEELNKAIDQMAAAARMDPAEYRSRLEDSGRMSSIRQQLLREKAVDLIVEHAKPVAPPEPDESDESADDAEEVSEQVPVASQTDPAAEKAGPADADEEERT